jgi:hypothetical protein
LPWPKGTNWHDLCVGKRPGSRCATDNASDPFQYRFGGGWHRIRLAGRNDFRAPKRLAMPRLLLAFCLAFSTLAIPQHVEAQADYIGAVGMRGGPGFGLSGKYFVTPNWAVEGHFTSRRRGLEMTGLVQRHHDLGIWRDLNGFYGGGAHIGFSEYVDTEVGHQRTQATIGLDAVAGLEYTLRTLPLAVAVDWKPEFNFTGATGVCWWCSGVTVRYTIQGHRYRSW